MATPLQPTGLKFLGIEVARGALQAIGGIVIYGLALWLLLSTVWSRLYNLGKDSVALSGEDAIRRAIQLRTGGLLPAQALPQRNLVDKKHDVDNIATHPRRPDTNMDAGSTPHDAPMTDMPPWNYVL
jgi:hypothetical protein